MVKNVIVGVSFGHPDTSAALIVDGDIIGAIAEERLGKRIKHDPNFPENAIKELLQAANLLKKDITKIAISRAPYSNVVQKGFQLLTNPTSSADKLLSFKRRNSEDRFSVIAPNAKVINVEHHLSHIAGAFYTSQFDEALGLTFDGSGDGVTATFSICENNKITILKKFFVPHSIGHFYSALCQYIGFDHFGEEYKVMGLAPYGEATFVSSLRKIISYKRSRGIRLDKRYFRVNKAYLETDFTDPNKMVVGKLYRDCLSELLGVPAKERKQPIEKVHMDLARSTQIVFEEIAFEMLQDLKSYRPDVTNLCLSGGCALNGVLNNKILSSKLFEFTHYNPASSDDGNSLGAALYVKHNIEEAPRSKELFNPYLGFEYSDIDIKDEISKYRLEYKEYSYADTIKRAAKDISEDKVIGWFQGRSEWGPRALGNRSILANPLNPAMKDILNKKIKKRESFRPFAPSILEEDLEEFFVERRKSPYMMHVVKFKDELHELLPSVVHVDGTGRLQTVSRKLNEKYWDLLAELKRLQAYGIVLNTSFNENEPIVEKPREALECFLRTDMDKIYLNNICISK